MNSEQASIALWAYKRGMEDAIKRLIELLSGMNETGLLAYFKSLQVAPQQPSTGGDVSTES